MLLGAPFGLLLSFIGLLRDRTKTAARLGLLISGGLVALFFILRLC